MNNINIIMIEGFLTKNPEITYIKNSTPVCKFIIGNNIKYRKSNGENVKQAHFFEVNSWKKVAEHSQKFLKKGSRVIITGILKTNVWKNEQGHLKSKCYIEAKDIKFISFNENIPEEEQQFSEISQLESTTSY